MCCVWRLANHDLRGGALIVNTNRSRVWTWLRERSPLVIGLRVYAQISRITLGAPLEKYSRLNAYLWVGGQHKRHGWSEMQASGIQAIVNLRSEYDDSRYGLAPENYLYLPTRDNTPPTLEQLQQGASFIQHQITEGRGVYVHCGVGVGRAPTLVAAYLVSEGMSPSEAWRTIRNVRPFILPLRGQVRRIEEFARMMG